jgi:hypothetical protein
MTRESDEDCLALIASIRDDHDRARGRPQWPNIDRLLDNLEARIEEIGRYKASHENSIHNAFQVGYESYAKDRRRKEHIEGEDCPCGTETCREAWRELRQAKADEENTAASSLDLRRREEARNAEEGAIRFRDVIREEVAAEVAVQLEVAFARLYAFVAGPDSLKSSDA